MCVCVCVCVCVYIYIYIDEDESCIMILWYKDLLNVKVNLISHVMTHAALSDISYQNLATSYIA